MIKTPTSHLNVYTFEDKQLINECVIEVKPLLIQNPKIFIYGKEVYQHRSIGFFSDISEGYRYSGQIAKSQPLSSNLKKLLDTINKQFNTDFNGILINLYKDGNDYIGSHSDDEKGLSNGNVVSISFGEPRTFRIRDKVTKKIIQDIKTEPYQIIHMGGDFQNEFTHEIPIQKKVKCERYSFTFRQHKE